MQNGQSTGPIRTTRIPVRSAPINGRFWLATIPKLHWTPPSCLPSECRYLRGQNEIGEGGFDHWQVVVCFKQTKRLAGAKQFFCPQAHVELSRSAAANQYVFKEDTRVEGSQFEYGELPKTCQKEMWKKVKAAAIAGNIDSIDIPDDIYVRYYGTLCRIAKDHSKPPLRTVVGAELYWGLTHSGKSYKAFNEATNRSGDGNVYRKSGSTKWWDGYTGETVVIIDEFRGEIPVTSLLEWLDVYPCRVETKGGSVPLRATYFYVTSNLYIDNWYIDLDQMTKDALTRRFNVIEEFSETFVINSQ